MTVGQIITNIAQEAHYRPLTMNGARLCHYDSQDEKKPLVKCADSPSVYVSSGLVPVVCALLRPAQAGARLSHKSRDEA